LLHVFKSPKRQLFNLYFRLSIRNIAYIGLRDIDSYERLVIDKFAITAFGMEDIERYGIIEVTNMALRRIDPNNNLPLHVSFDIDSLDALEAPSTGTPGKVMYALTHFCHI
jgi:arginase